MMIKPEPLFLDPFADSDLDPLLADLLRSISSRIVVVGSVARGKVNPKDIDVLFDMDSAKSETFIRDAVKASGLAFYSAFVGSWSFEQGGLQVEILPISYGPGYRATRKRARLGTVAGVELLIARPEDAPKGRSA